MSLDSISLCLNSLIIVIKGILGQVQITDNIQEILREFRFVNSHHDGFKFPLITKECLALLNDIHIPSSLNTLKLLLYIDNNSFRTAYFLFQNINLSFKTSIGVCPTICPWICSRYIGPLLNEGRCPLGNFFIIQALEHLIQDFVVALCFQLVLVN